MKHEKSRAKVIVKSLSWAVVSGLIIFTTALVETGMYKAALITALVSALLKTPFYSVHEVAFDALWHRKQKGVQADAAPVVEPEPLKIAG